MIHFLNELIIYRNKNFFSISVNLKKGLRCSVVNRSDGSNLTKFIVNNREANNFMIIEFITC